MDTRLLITCFEPFAGRVTNTSMRLMGPLICSPPTGVATRVLPVDFALLRRRIPRLVRDMQPRRWLLLGEDAGGERMRCERVAVNSLEGTAVDNRGVRPGGKAVRGGPAAYFATLDPARLVSHFRGHSIPAGLSDDAGTYACNLALYLALHHSRRLEARMEIGFVHVPRSYRKMGHSLKSIRQSLLDLVENLASGKFEAA